MTKSHLTESDRAKSMIILGVKMWVSIDSKTKSY